MFSPPPTSIEGRVSCNICTFACIMGLENHVVSKHSPNVKSCFVRFYKLEALDFSQPHVKSGVGSQAAHGKRACIHIAEEELSFARFFWHELCLPFSWHIGEW